MRANSEIMTKKGKIIKSYRLEETRVGLPLNAPHLDYDVVICHIPLQGMQSEFPFTFHFNTCTVVDSGEACIVLDTQEYHLTKGCFLIIQQYQVVLFKSCTTDFKGKVLMFSNDFINSLNISESIKLSQIVKNSPCTQLTEEMYQSFDLYMIMITKTLERKENPHQKEIIYHLTKAYFYGLGYYLHANDKVQSNPINRSQELSLQFFDLLRQHFKKERTIAFFAEKLHVSPKYLSSCIKEATGEKAMNCIIQQVITYAESMLSQTHLTIAQISDELNFDSPSTFGKYFCKYKGMSPKEWRLLHQS